MNAADSDEFAHQIFTTRLEVGNHRHFLANAREVINGNLHLGSAGHSEEVEHGVGGAAQCNDHGDSVFKRLLGHNIPRLNVVFQEI